MKAIIKKSIWSGLCLIGVGLLTGCQNDNLFDSKYTPTAYEQSFVVKNVSADMDWKTTTKASVSITVDEDNDVLYKVQIFDENPLIAASNAKLLTSGFAKTNQKFETEIDYPTALNTVYVCRIDTVGRRIVRPVVINNGVIATSFVGDGASLPSSSRSIAQAAMVVDVNVAPYTVTTINEMLATAHLFDTGRNKALDDATLYPKNYSDNKFTTIKLTGTYSGTFSTWGTYSIPGTVRLIITGTCTLSDATSINQGVEIIVANGGKLIISSSKAFTLNERSLLTVMPGGSVSGNSVKCSALSKIYNGGSFALTGELSMNTSTFVNATGAAYSVGTSSFSSVNSIYNYSTFTTGAMSSMGNTIINQQNATMTVTGTYEAQNTGTKGWLYNYGTFTTNKIIGGGAVNIYNGCKLLVTTLLETNELINGQSSYVECDTYKANNLGTVRLEANSIFKVKTSAALYATNITGPTSGWALLKIKSISYGSIVQNGGSNTKLDNGYIINNIHIEYSDMTAKGVYWPNNGFDWLQVMINGNGNVNTTATQNTQLVGNGNTDIALYGEAPLVIPSGDCTPGNIPTSFVPEVTTTSIKYTYAFEDNFPNVGDYDFNDVVMDVKWDETRNQTTNGVTQIVYHVTLAAVGATRELAGGLRLIGVNKSAIFSVEFGGSNLSDFQSTLKGIMFYPTTNGFESNNTDVVIPLFEDAHKVLTGATLRKVVNTNIDKVATATAKTLDIKIKFTTPLTTAPISKDNLDFFIAYNGVGKPNGRNEIHLFEFRDIQSAVGLNNSKYIAAAENYPWAICIPEFRYPIENTPIVIAYEGFTPWAQAPKAERQQYEGWYKTVSADKKVFR